MNFTTLSKNKYSLYNDSQYSHLFQCACYTSAHCIFPCKRYSLLSAGPGADPGVQAVSLQVIHPVVGYHYFLAGLRLPSQPQSITAPWLVPSYTAWLWRHIGVNNLPKVVMQLLPRVGFEPTTCCSQVQRSTRCATARPYFLVCICVTQCQLIVAIWMRMCLHAGGI